MSPLRETCWEVSGRCLGQHPYSAKGQSNWQAWSFAPVGGPVFARLPYLCTDFPIGSFPILGPSIS